MASKNPKVIQGIAIADADGERRKYLNTANGRIEDLPSQKMVFDTETGKLMVVLSSDKTIALDNRVFTEMDADGFFCQDSSQLSTRSTAVSNPFPWDMQSFVTDRSLALTYVI